MKQFLLAGLTVLAFVFIDFIFVYFTGIDTGKLGKFETVILYYVVYISLRLNDK